MASGLGKRYARAILASAQEAGAGDAVADELVALAAAFDELPEARFFFGGTGISKQGRIDAAREIASSMSLSTVTASALEILVNAGRMDAIGEIARSLRELADTAAGRVRAEVTVARAMSAKEKSSVAASVSRLIGSEVILSEKVDPAVIGGARVVAGGILIDGTVSGALAKVNASLDS